MNATTMAAEEEADGGGGRGSGWRRRRRRKRTRWWICSRWRRKRTTAEAATTMSSSSASPPPSPAAAFSSAFSRMLGLTHSVATMSIGLKSVEFGKNRYRCLVICPSEKEIETYYRFGVSKISVQYKVIVVDSQSECLVYTLGTESWRKVEALASIDEFYFGSAAFVNGSLYWTDPEPEHNQLLACFDLETECFSSFPPPATGMVQLFVLKDCLCFCRGEEDGIVIWSMLENGGERSWRKDYVTNNHISYRFNINLFFALILLCVALILVKICEICWYWFCFELILLILECFFRFYCSK